jgi:hypothetical protein
MMDMLVNAAPVGILVGLGILVERYVLGIKGQRGHKRQ